MKSLFDTRWKPPKSAVHTLCRWRTGPASPPPGFARNNRSKLPPRGGKAGGPAARHFDPRQLRDGLQRSSEANLGEKRTSFTIRRNYQLLQTLTDGRFFTVIQEMGSWAKNQDEWRSFGLTNQSQLDRELGLFKLVLRKAFDLAVEHGKTSRPENPLFWNLRNAFVRFDAAGLDRELKYAFQTFLMRSRFPKAVNELHMALADLRYPYEWYPATRMMQRTIHLHVGPTNSGKTYNALKALENARTGVYAGPLRLLAHEIWHRFTAKKQPCALVTGEEMRIPEDSDTWFQSCTVEMTPLNQKFDVAVIDEIQMIANDERGWAWSQAFLGVQAKEIHLCGEDRVVPLIEDLCRRLGEKCIVHRYERLNPLEVKEESLGGKFSNLRKGDAIVAFSRVSIHQLKAGIEKETGKRCAIVYGSLPPETRASQAALFNDPDNEYDFLVASDAIGMGLNLEIKRVIFESSFKFDGLGFRPLTVPEFRQIGGRAGRYRTAAQAMSGDVTAPLPGEVTSLDAEDLPLIQAGFLKEPPPLPSAGLFPPPSVIERFHSYFPPRTPISFVLARLREMSRLAPRFHLCDFSLALQIAEIIKPFDLSVSDRCVFLNVPVNLRDPAQVAALQAFARCVADMASGHLLDFPSSAIDLDVLGAVRPDAGPDQAAYLHKLESLHRVITMYLWLSYRYQGVFQSQALAFQVKQEVEHKIAEHLEKLSFVPSEHRGRRRRLRELAAANEHKLGIDEKDLAELGLGGVHDEGIAVEEPLFDGEGAEAGSTATVPPPVTDKPAQQGSVGA